MPFEPQHMQRRGWRKSIFPCRRVNTAVSAHPLRLWRTWAGISCPMPVIPAIRSRWGIRTNLPGRIGSINPATPYPCLHDQACGQRSSLASRVSGRAIE